MKVLTAKICPTKFYFMMCLMLNLMKLNFLENFGTLYDLLKDLVASKIQIANANVDQIRFTVYLMMGYYEKDSFMEETNVFTEKSDSWQSKAFDMARIIFKVKKNH